MGDLDTINFNLIMELTTPVEHFREQMQQGNTKLSQMKRLVKDTTHQHIQMTKRGG